MTPAGEEPMDYLTQWQWAFELGRQLEPGEALGWKTTRPDLTTDGHGGPEPRYYPGAVLETTAYVEANEDACPLRAGDGYCVARTFAGAASGELPLGPVVVLAWSGMLGEVDEKLRCRRVRVLTLWDGPRLIWEGGRGADLSRADLTGADLTGADLTGANLRRANLSRAALYEANLSRAALYEANLSRANLRRADLNGADLRGADLTGADLTGADLRGADLTWADLTWADLTGADLGPWERGPDGRARRIS